MINFQVSCSLSISVTHWQQNSCSLIIACPELAATEPSSHRDICSDFNFVCNLDHYNIMRNIEQIL
jgi:hypothetical protein